MPRTVFFGLLLIVGGCGIQGDLYLPDNEEAPIPDRQAPVLQEDPDEYQGRY